MLLGYIGKETSGWWYTIPSPLKYDGLRTSWDDDIPITQWKGIEFMFQTTNQNLFLPVFLPLIAGNILDLLFPFNRILGANEVHLPTSSKLIYIYIG